MNTMHTAQEVVSRVGDLAALPSVYAKVRRLVEDPNSSPDQLSRVIAVDAVITARLLRLANSAFWGRGGRIETVSRAVRLLGMNHVHDLVLATSVATAFKGLDPAVVDAGRFWRASVYRALAAGALAAKRELIDIERLFLEGLLSDIGHLAMYQTIPSLTAEAADRARLQPWMLSEIETSLIGCNFAEVGAALAESWMLPECFTATIAHQTNPLASATHALEACIVHVASRLAQRPARRDDPAEPPPLPEAVLQFIALPTETIEEAAAEADANLSAMVQLFTPALAAA
jgi:HD-like signal output (HDOD) protein